jgi:hypothetical protein
VTEPFCGSIVRKPTCNRNLVRFPVDPHLRVGGRRRAFALAAPENSVRIPESFRKGRFSRLQRLGHAMVAVNATVWDLYEVLPTVPVKYSLT